MGTLETRPHTQTDRRTEWRQPGLSPLVGSHPSCGPDGTPLAPSSALSDPAGCPPPPHIVFTGQRKPSQEGVLNLGPPHCTLGSKNWSLEVLPLPGPQFPNLYKAEEGRSALRGPPCPDFPWSPFLPPYVQPQLSSRSPPFHTVFPQISMPPTGPIAVGGLTPPLRGAALPVLYGKAAVPFHRWED